MNYDLIVMSVYPLSSEYIASLRKELNQEFYKLTLSELRQYNAFRLLLKIRNIRSNMLIMPLEDENSIALLPIVKLLAALTKTEKLLIIYPDMHIQRITRIHIATDFIKLVMASLFSLLSAIESWIELKGLLKAYRINIAYEDIKKKVLYLKTNLWFGIKAGGSVGHIAGVVNALQNKNYPITFASAEPPVLVNSDVRIIKIDPPKTFGLPYELNNYRFQKGFRVKASKILKNSKFTLIYQRLSAANYLGVHLSRDYGLPLVVEYNGSEVWIAKNWGRTFRFHALATMAEEVMLRHAHLVVTISEVLKEELISKGIEPARIIFYPNCIDPNIFDPQRFSPFECNELLEHYSIPYDATVITFIGTFGQWHGAEVLAAAIERIYMQNRSWLIENKVHFLFVGDGLKMPKVRTILEDSGAIKHCTLTGLVPQDQAALHLSAADILISPHVPNSDGTRFFGSPTKLFEYMAMGKGIVASDLDQIGEVLSPGLKVKELPVSAPNNNNIQTAVLTQPGNIEELIEGIKFLVERKDWRAHLGKNARARALSKYTWSHHVDEILKGLDRVYYLDTSISS